VGIRVQALGSVMSGSFNTPLGNGVSYAIAAGGNFVIGHGVFGAADESNHIRIKNIANAGQANFQYVHSHDFLHHSRDSINEVDPFATAEITGSSNFDRGVILSPASVVNLDAAGAEAFFFRHGEENSLSRPF